MNVRELIERLNGFDHDLPVMTPGFDESGFSDIADPVIKKMALYRSEHTVWRVPYVSLFSENCIGRMDGEPFDAVILDFS